MIETPPPPKLGYFGSHFIFTSRKNWMNSEWESIIIIGILLFYAGLHIWKRVGKEKQKSGKGWICLTRQNQGVWKAHVVWLLKLQRKLAQQKENVQQRDITPHISHAQQSSSSPFGALPPLVTFFEGAGCCPPLQAPASTRKVAEQFSSSQPPGYRLTGTALVPQSNLDRQTHSFMWLIKCVCFVLKNP